MARVDPYRAQRPAQSAGTQPANSYADLMAHDSLASTSSGMTQAQKAPAQQSMAQGTTYQMARPPSGGQGAPPPPTNTQGGANTTYVNMTGATAETQKNNGADSSQPKYDDQGRVIGDPITGTDDPNFWQDEDGQWHSKAESQARMAGTAAPSGLSSGVIWNFGKGQTDAGAGINDETLAFNEAHGGGANQGVSLQDGEWGGAPSSTPGDTYDQQADAMWKDALSDFDKSLEGEMSQTYADEARAGRINDVQSSMLGRDLSGGGYAAGQAQVALGGMQQRQDVMSQHYKQGLQMKLTYLESLIKRAEASKDRALQERLQAEADKTLLAINGASIDTTNYTGPAEGAPTPYEAPFGLDAPQDEGGPTSMTPEQAQATEDARKRYGGLV